MGEIAEELQVLEILFDTVYSQVEKSVLQLTRNIIIFQRQRENTKSEKWNERKEKKEKENGKEIRVDTIRSWNIYKGCRCDV